MQLTGEVPALEALQLNRLIETIAPGYLRRPPQQKPCGNPALAHVIDGLSGCESALVRFGETSYDIELCFAKPWKALSAAITDWHNLFELLWCPHVRNPSSAIDPTDVAP
jgi:hypothetical protein